MTLLRKSCTKWSMSCVAQQPPSPPDRFLNVTYNRLVCGRQHVEDYLQEAYEIGMVAHMREIRKDPINFVILKSRLRLLFPEKDGKRTSRSSKRTWSSRTFPKTEKPPDGWGRSI